MNHIQGSRWRGLIAALSVVLLLLSLPGCSAFSQLQFAQDHRLQIVQPENLSTVDVPFTVKWELTNSEKPPSERYAVFLDRYPMPPTGNLRDIVDQDPQCRGNDRCLSADYLARSLGIYVTDTIEVKISAFPPTVTVPVDDSHFVTVVLIDAHGNRTGESVWYTSFRVNR